MTNLSELLQTLREEVAMLRQWVILTRGKRGTVEFVTAMRMRADELESLVAKHTHEPR